MLYRHRFMEKYSQSRSALDKQITQSKSKLWRFKIVQCTVAIIIITIIYQAYVNSSNGQIQNVSKNTTTISDVQQGDFSDTLNARGIIVPKQTIYLDAMAGGRVEKKLVERGSYVEQGQALLQLSNTALQLDVISREAQISEQLNFLRNTQMNAETNRLNLRRDIIDNDNQIAHLKRKIKKFDILMNKNYVSAEELSALKQDLTYFNQRKTLNLQRQQQQEKIRTLQIKQLEDSAKMLQENLIFARRNLENLVVTAPVSGYLSEFNVELGESKPVGSRLGQIDIPEEFKIQASLDEYYLPLTSNGMTVNVEFNGITSPAQISKIDSRVNEGQFSVDVEFSTESDELSKQLKRGQSVELEILLSKVNEPSLLLPRGAFVTATGGYWVFVLDSEENRAQRRPITLGQKNKQYFQVISGLNAGDKVITSSYSLFDKADTVILN